MAQLPTLFDVGWRQGSILRSRLPLVTATLPLRRRRLSPGLFASKLKTFSRQRYSANICLQQHPIWIVASQDCDLDSHSIDENQACIEIRPLYDDHIPESNGIRSREIRVTETLYARADSPRLSVSPDHLNSLLGKHDGPLSSDRAQAFKTWLGLRYDRPAVPPEHLSLMREISKRTGGKPKEIHNNISDVLVQIGEGSPPLFQVFVVVESHSDIDTVREWAAECLAKVSTSLGVLEVVDVGTKAETSLELIETSYSADLSDITWKWADGPRGAR